MSLVPNAVLYLIDAAEKHEVVSYSDMGSYLGVAPHALDSIVLGFIRDAICLANELPPLTAIVVNKDQFRPGAGFWNAWPQYKRDMWDEVWVDMVKQVFAYDWSRLKERHSPKKRGRWW